MERGQLPAGWVEVKLGDLAFFVMGQAPPGTASNFSGDGEIFVKAGEFGVRHPVVREWTTMPLKYATSNDVLVCVVGATAGKLNLGIDCAIGRSVAAIQPSEAIGQLLLYFQLLLSVEKLRGSSTGSAQGVISKKMLSEIDILLPPLNEQQRIAVKLDSTLSAVDACRERLDGVAAILKRFRQAVLVAAMSGELTREWREERGSQWSPRELTVGDLGTIVTGNTPKAVNEDAREEVPLFKPTELDAGYEVRYAKELMGEKRALGARMLPPLSVLVTCIGATIGKTGLSRIPGATNQQINAIICNPKIATPQWTYFWLTSPVGQASIVDNASATTLPIINKSRFSALEVDVPDIEEQQEIVQLVESLFTLADQLEAKLTTAIRIVERLTPALLAKAFRGELVAQVPNVEPASVLLERIRAARQAGAGTGKPSRRRRRKTLANSELISLTPTPVPTNDPSRVFLVGTGDETTQGERGPNRVSKSKPLDYSKGWDSMQKSLIEVLEQHQAWISASMACKELGISDGSTSDDLELFYRQLKEHIENGVVDVQRRGDEDWLKLSSCEAA